MQREEYFDFLHPEDIRLKGHRIGLDDIVEHYLDGYTPEEIVAYYGTLRPVEVYATITYYLQNRKEVDDYLVRVKAWREQHRQEIAAQEPTPALLRVRALYAERERL